MKLIESFLGESLEIFLKKNREEFHKKFKGLLLEHNIDNFDKEHLMKFLKGYEEDFRKQTNH